MPAYTTSMFIIYYSLCSLIIFTQLTLPRTSSISTMPKRSKVKQQEAQQVHNQAAWKPVSVGLDDKNVDADENDNHYDNPKLQRAANKDLPVQPGEDVAMFYGLEVLDSSQYCLVKEGDKKRLIILQNDREDNSEQQSEEGLSARQKRKRGISIDESVPINDRANAKKAAAALQKGIEDQTSQSKKSKAITVDEKVNKTEHGSAERKQNEAKGDKAPKKKKSKKPLKHVSTVDSPEPNPQQVLEIQMAWSSATGGALLQEQLCKSLAKLGYSHPTPIQAATLSAAIMGRRNLVGAAPTGSGKTLAFLLPILQHLLEQEEADENRVVQALILTPTRELAQQIQKECENILPKQCITLTGGIALVKQVRLLQSKPRVIVATPGRLWAMISSEEHPFLQDLSRIRFLVLDEADRMIEKHCFPQLLQILEAVDNANPGEEDSDQEEDDAHDREEEEDWLGSLPGVRGEAKVAMLTDDILQHVDLLKAEPAAQSVEVADNEIEGEEEEIGDERQLEELYPSHLTRVKRQTFIYSATLTLPHTSTTGNSTFKKKRQQSLGLDGAIAEILEKARAMGETKIVDLSSSSTTVAPSGRSINTPKGVRLPPGLELKQIKCTQRHKDSHLYAYLVTTAQGASGPCLVFCNSIAGVRRVGSTLQKLGLPVRLLHAQMQQRARFKAVESLQNPKSRAIVIATDVASRGLDIPTVATVVHYDVARAVDTFVHRAGRTARGVGEGAVGSSVSLVAPAEDKAHSRIVEAAQVHFSNVIMDGRLLSSAQERTNLASKIVVAEDVEQKTKHSNQWFLENAENAGLEVDDDLLEDDRNRPPKEQMQLNEARKAKTELARLLAEPIKTQRFGKFLSTNAAAVRSI